MRLIVILFLVMASSCGPKRATVAVPDPFDRLLGINITDYLAVNEPPHQIVEGSDGAVIYSWRWETAYTTTTERPGYTVNIGRVGKPNYVRFGGGADSATTAQTYWLNLVVKNGLIERYGYSLPKDKLPK